MPSNTDLEYAFYGAVAQGSLTGTMKERRRAYYVPSQFDFFAAGSGLTPKEKYTLADHRLAYYRAQTGLPTATLAEARRTKWGG